MDDSRAARLERWERCLQLPLMVASLLFVAAYAWPILDPGLDPAWCACARSWCGRPGSCSSSSWRAVPLGRGQVGFVVHHPLDVAAAILPVLRPLRLLRLLTLLNVLNRYAGSSLRGRVGVYLFASASLIIFMGALAVLDAERGSSGPIQTFGDALWWAMTTITTVGYGDMYPVTTEGRFVAAGLMFCGIAVLGVVTATFASWLVERVEQIEEDIEESVTATAADVHSLRAEILALRELLERR